MTARSYSDLSDSATTFDPEEQFDRDIDERMKGMTKEELLGKVTDELLAHAIFSHRGTSMNRAYAMDAAKSVIAIMESFQAADKWDAEQRVRSPADQYRLDQKPIYPDAPNMGISPGLDSAIQDQLDHGPKSIVSE